VTQATPAAAPAVRIAGVSHTFRGGGREVAVLDDVSLIVPAGGFVSLVGPSGCGKSTLLRVLAGLLAPDSGEAEVLGRDAILQPGLVAYMPQKDLLLPWRRVLANATLGAEVAGVPRPEARRRAEALLPRFGLAGFERSWPVQLSGGMRQRLALLRTFLTPSNVLLLDEPFGALDAITRREMHRWLQQVLAEDGRTVLFVTHDVEEALILSDTVVVMSPRPGRIAARVEVPFARPRPGSLVVDADFVRLKGTLLSALEAG
jgi:ABC-type nitrate/sulfonate/bicarbonate transport system ATPase subunit